MNRFLATIIAFVSIQSSAFADGPTTSPGFAGYYAGVSYGENTGFWAFVPCCTTAFDLEGSFTQVYAGVNFENNALLYGVEAAYSVGGTAYQAEINNDTVFPEYNYSSVLDLKARAGTTLSNFLVYGFLGYSWAAGDFGYLESIGTYHGTNYGVGAEALIGDRYTLGIEYIYRNLDNAPAGFSAIDAHVETVSVRVGVNF